MKIFNRIQLQFLVHSILDVLNDAEALPFQGTFHRFVIVVVFARHTWDISIHVRKKTAAYSRARIFLLILGYIRKLNIRS